MSTREIVIVPFLQELAAIFLVKEGMKGVNF
jgi:hypothetical protein